MKQPPVIGNPLAVLGCWLVGATVHVGQVPVTAGTPQEGPAHVGRMSACCGTARAAGSCVEAIIANRWSVALKPAQGLCSDGARGMPRGTHVAHMLLFEVELTFLACVAEATWANADVEMRKLVCRATGAHASFHIWELHGFKLVCGSPQTAAQLVIPAYYR